MFSFSRILPLLGSFAQSFAADETQAAAPYVKAAVDELPGDLRSADPIHAFLTTAKNAYEKMKADPAVTPSLTGILAGVARALV